jgi:threonine aldolase
MDGFLERLTSAVRISEAFYAQLSRHPKVLVERIPNGTNLTRLTLKGVAPAEISSRLAGQGFRLPAPGPGGMFTLAVNETWNRTTAADLVRAFEESLG